MSHPMSSHRIKSLLSTFLLCALIGSVSAADTTPPAATSAAKESTTPATITTNASATPATEQTPAAASSENTSAAPSAAPAAEPFFAKEGPMQRCTDKSFRKCMKFKDEAACQQTVGEAVDAVNAGIAEQTKGKPMDEGQKSFYQGYAIGNFMGEMIKRSEGRFLQCLQKR